MRDYIQPSARKVGINKKMSWHTSHVLDVAQGQWRGCESRARTFETLNGQDDAGHRCTRGKYRTLAIHTCEPARQRAHALAQTPAFAISQRARRKVEALFAELKNYIGLRRVRLRRMRFVREQFYLAATAQNLKRLVRFLRRKPIPELATA